MPVQKFKRSLRRIKKKQQGGDGQGNRGHDVSMPIQFFGKELNRYYEANSPELVASDSAYGPTIATSHGVSIAGDTTQVGPDLGAFHKDIGISGIQTGGNRGKKKSLRKVRKQRGGDGQGNQGHDVSMPIQFFGGKLDRYFPEGSPELIPPNSAYGPTIATSHGVSIPGNNEFVGPDLAPFNSGVGISGLQTGGGAPKKNSKKKKGGERLSLKSVNMDNGPPFHPQWGGNKKNQQNKKSNKKQQQQKLNKQQQQQQQKSQQQRKLSKQQQQQKSQQQQLKRSQQQQPKLSKQQQQKSQQQQRKLSQKKEQLKKLQKEFKELQKEIKQTGGDKLNLRCANMDCGPPFHPQWGGAMVTEEELDGGAMVTEEELDGGAMLPEEEQDGGAMLPEEEQDGGGC